LTINQIGIAHRRVLIVEDNLFIAVGLARLLRPKGVEIIGPAATVKEALALVSDGERIDGAALDLHLRGEMAYPVADALSVRGARIVFMTGYDETWLKPGYAEIPCLQKPVMPERLMRASLRRRLFRRFSCFYLTARH